jgi:hypothetical protein
MTLHRILQFSALVLASAVASHSSQAAARLGACELITPQEATSALGAPVPAGIEKPMDFAPGTPIKGEACIFGSALVVARYQLGTAAPELFDKYRQEFAATASASDYQTVSGVGDEAFTAKGQLMVRKGQTGLLVGVSLGDRQNSRIALQQLQSAKRLAALALGRM